MNRQFYLKQYARLNASKTQRELWVFFGIYALLFYGLIAGRLFFLPGGFRAVSVAIVAGFFTRYAVCEIFYFFHKKAHPYQRLGFKPPTSWLFSFADQKPDAFPSQHTATMAAVSAAIFMFNIYAGALAFLIALLTAMARVVLGYHDFADVIAGLILGSAAGLLVYHIAGAWLFTR